MIKLEDKFNNIWTFFIDNNNNLSYTLNNENKQILYEECSNEFDICFDEQGFIHIAFQVETGEIYYIKYDYKDWKKYIILKNKNKQKCFNNIKIFYINNKLELFYTLFHNYKYHLVHHIFDFNSQLRPLVLDYCLEGNFSICQDSESNIYIVYKNENNEIIRKKYDVLHKSYTDLKIMNGENVKDIIGICDNMSFNILYTEITPTYYTVIFENITSNLKYTLGFGSDSVCKLSYYKENGQLNIFWHERIDTYRCLTTNVENGFTKPQFFGRNLESCILKRYYLKNEISYRILKKVIT